MDLIHALRTTGSVRDFTDRPVTDDVLSAILDDARFAPSGGNRQAWHVIVVRDPGRRETLRDLYLDGWHDYVAHRLARLTPFSPLATETDRAAAFAQRDAAVALSQPNGFPESLDRVPVMLAVLADLTALAATDRDLGRYQIAGGASIYPFVWNILLSAHERGVGGVMTTVAIRNERGVLDALNAPPNFALASIVALGYPAKKVTKLTRRAVGDFTTVDAFDGARFGAD